MPVDDAQLGQSAVAADHRRLAVRWSSLRGRVIKRIPKASRIATADALRGLADQCVQNNDEASWLRLLGFPTAGLLGPRRGGRHAPSKSTVIKQQVQAYINSLSAPPAECKSSYPTNRDVAKAISAKLSDGDIRGAVRIASSDNSLLGPSAETIAKLREKHPRAPADASFPDAPSVESHSGIVLEPPALMTALNTFPNGSSGGCDGLRPQHLKDLVSCSNGAAGANLLKSLCQLGGLMLNGRVPAAVTPLLYGASLCALGKKDGSVRPIAVGNTLRRLVAKASLFTVRDVAASLLSPHQFGFGVPNGCEIAAHAARLFCSNPSQEVQAICKVDFSNAFNTVRRDVVLHLIKQHFPSLYAFAHQCYRHESYLVFGEHCVASAQGVQQGDPLGPLLFCMAIMNMSNNLQSAVNLWYLDDGLLAGTPDAVQKDLSYIVRTASEIGLSVNITKCEILCNGGDFEGIEEAYSAVERVAQGITRADTTMAFLGTALFLEGRATILADKIDKLSSLVQRLKDLRSHDALFLLKNCIAIPRLYYLLRTSPCFSHPLIGDYDQQLRQGLELITNNSLGEASWAQATLPVASGGLGVRCASQLALPAFLASSHSVSSAVSKILPPERCYDREKVSAIALMAECPSNCASQGAWDAILVERQKAGLLSATEDNPQQRCRLLAAFAKHSGDWLNAIPNVLLGTQLDDNQLRVAVACRIGSAMCHPHKCRGCGAAVDSYGLHGLSCRKSAGRHSRHHALNDLIHRAFTSAGLPSLLEPPGICRSDGKRPDGVTLVP